MVVATNTSLEVISEGARMMIVLYTLATLHYKTFYNAFPLPR